MTSLEYANDETPDEAEISTPQDDEFTRDAADTEPRSRHTPPEVNADEDADEWLMEALRRLHDSPRSLAEFLLLPEAKQFIARHAGRLLLEAVKLSDRDAIRAVNAAIRAHGEFPHDMDSPLVAALRLRRYDLYDVALEGIEPDDFRYPRPGLIIECADPHMIRQMILARPYADRDIGSSRIKEAISASFQQGSPTIIRTMLAHYAREGFDILDKHILREAAHAPSLVPIQVLLKPIGGYRIEAKQLDRLLAFTMNPNAGVHHRSALKKYPCESFLPPAITPEDAPPTTANHNNMKRRPARLLLFRKVRLLLNAGASPNTTSADRTINTVLTNAIELDHTAAARLLLWRGAKTEGESTNAFRFALCEGEWPAIQMLIRHGYSLDECVEDTFWLNDRSAHLLDKIPWTDARLNRFVRMATEQPEAAQYLLGWSGLSAEHREFLEKNPAPTWEEFLEECTAGNNPELNGESAV